MTTAQRSKTNPRAVDIGASLTFDLSRPGRSGVLLPEADVPPAPLPGARSSLGPSRLNYGVDTGFSPLGSCTMKYNPKVNEDVARLPGFALAHPLQPQATVQGAL